MAPGSLVLGLATLPLSGAPAQAAGVGLTGPFALNNWKLIPTVESSPKTQVGYNDGIAPTYVCASASATACVDGPSLTGGSPIVTGPPGGFTVVGAKTGDYGSSAGNTVDIAWKLQYTGDAPYRLTFDYYFESGDVAGEDKGYFAINNIKLVESTGTSDFSPGLSFLVNKNDTIAFGVLTANVDSQIGLVQITNFDATEVPAPLPLLGAGAAFGWSRRLRRRIRTQAGVAVR